MMKKMIVASVLIGWCAVTFNFQASAQEENWIPVNKSVSGFISWLDRGTLSVVYKQDQEKFHDHEMDFKLSENVVVRNKRRLSDLQLGDVVKIDYIEYMEEYDRLLEGGRTEKATRVKKRDMRVIHFVRQEKSKFSSGV